MTSAARLEKEPVWCDPTRHGLAFKFDREFAAKNVNSLFPARMSMGGAPAPGGSSPKIRVTN